MRPPAISPAALEALRKLPRDQMVPADAPERFVEEFVDALDLKRLGFVDRHRPNRRDPHPTSKLLKLVLFAALVRIVGQRALARACRVNVSLLYLSAFDPPGRSSITRFWRDNHRVFPDVLVMLVHHAAEAGLVGMDLHALDGTCRASLSLVIPRRTPPTLYTRWIS